MDIFTHAAVGAATGAAFGRPVLGAAVATLPDLGYMLHASFLERLHRPPKVYDFGHSLLFVLLLSLCTWVLVDGGAAAVVGLALLSHLWLDLPTHGRTWGVRLFYPLQWRFKCGVEWEFFNRSWFFGLAWGFVWLAIVYAAEAFY